MRDSWTVRDFVLIWVAGLTGGLLLGGVGFLVSDDASIVLALAGSMAGNVIALGILYRRKRDPELGFAFEFGDIFYLALGLGMQFALALLLEPLAQILVPDGAPAQDVAQELTDPEASALLRVVIVVAAVMVAPLVEEIVFRGVLLKALAHRGRRFAMVTTAALFAGVHILTLTEPILATAALVLPPLFILGVVLAWVTQTSGRLGPAILTHTGFNALSALVLFIPPELLESLGG